MDPVTKKAKIAEDADSISSTRETQPASSKSKVADTPCTKILDLFAQQHQARKSDVDGFIKAFSEIILQAEADYLVMEDNEQKVKQLCGLYMKSMQQATLTCELKLKALYDVKSYFEEMSNKIEAAHQEEIKKANNMLKNYMDQFKKENQRKNREDLCRNIFQTFKKDF